MLADCITTDTHTSSCYPEWENDPHCIYEREREGVNSAYKINWQEGWREIVPLGLIFILFSRLLNENSILTEPIELPNMKRHSEGTFSNDYSKYLETRRAQDFVQWLKNSKRNGWVTFSCLGEKLLNSSYDRYHMCRYHVDLYFLTEVYSDAMRTAPTPVMWAPTCRTRRQRSSSPGWRPAEADESRPNQSACRLSQK